VSHHPWENHIVSSSAVARLVVGSLAAVGAVTFAVHLADEPAESRTAGGGRTSVMAPGAEPGLLVQGSLDQGFLDPVQSAAPSVVIRASSTSARVALESTVPHPVPSSTSAKPAAPERRGPVPVDMSGAATVLPGYEDLGDVHVDPTPAGVSLSDPTDTASLYEAAGLAPTVAADSGAPDDATVPGDSTVAADGSAPAAAFVPGGRPSTLGLTQHVAPSCSGTGQDGNRVQALYLRESTTPSRYADVLPILRNEIANVDDVFAVSAQQTGGERRVRWVHDGSCVPMVPEVVVPAGSLGDFTATIKALRAAGYTDPARKYLAFADAAALCGVGTLYEDPSVSNNMNDGRAASYARVDAPCWSAGGHSVAAHELTHNLGSILTGAPHATAANHCTDEADLMCYVDGAGVTMRSVCPSSQEQLLDCNHDDYFNTDPQPGNFLHDHWNTARSSFLDADVLGGTVEGGTLDSGTAPPVNGEATGWTTPTLTPGDPVRLRAALSSAGLPLAGAPVALQSRSATDGVWRTVAELTSAADGSVQVERRRAGAAWYRFAYLGQDTDGLAPSTSEAVLVKARTHVEARWQPRRQVVVGRMLRIDGTPVAGARVVLERRYAGGDWVRVGHDVSSSTGRLHLKQTPRHAAYFRWVYGGDETLLGARSSSVRARR
jgi:hypothetical protein